MSDKCPECGKTAIAVMEGRCIYCWRDHFDRQIAAKDADIEQAEVLLRLFEGQGQLTGFLTGGYQTDHYG